MQKQEDKNKKILIAGALLVGGYLLYQGYKATANAIQGMPVLLVKGFSISRSGGYVNILIQNPGNMTFHVQSVQANVNDNNDRIATISDLPGAGNGLVILPYSSTTMKLKVTIDPVGAVSAGLTYAEQLYNDISKSGSVVDAAGHILSMNNLGEIVKDGESIVKLFQGSGSGSSDSSGNVETVDYGNSESVNNTNTDTVQQQDATDYGTSDNSDNTDWQNMYSDPSLDNTDNSGNTDFTGDSSGDGTDSGLAGWLGADHVITIDGTVNVDGINIPLNQNITALKV